MKPYHIEFRHTYAHQLQTKKIVGEQIQVELLVNAKNKKIQIYLDDQVRNHQTILGWLYSNSLYEPDVSNFMLKIVEPGDLVVDVGSNIGFHSILLGALVEEQGSVIAFEPSEHNILEMQRNIDLNNIENIDIRKSFIGKSPKDKIRFFFDKSDTGNSHGTKEVDGLKPGGQKVSTSTLDIELDGRGPIKLVKADVEGFEGDVLRGAAKILQKNIVKYWVVEYAPHLLNRNGDDVDSLRDYMERFGLSTFVLDDSGKFPKLFPPGVFIYSDKVLNLLFAKTTDLSADWPVEKIIR